MVSHDVLVWGPAAEGERTSRGTVIAIPGWVWTCSCGQAGFGNESEVEAEYWADHHIGVSA
jgi:hypothetical protein